MYTEKFWKEFLLKIIYKTLDEPTIVISLFKETWTKLGTNLPEKTNTLKHTSLCLNQNGNLIENIKL